MNEVAVRFLGSGDAFGSGGRFQTCIHVRSATMGFLIDCGASSLVAMKRWGATPGEISTILLTHLHGDHFGGVPFFILDGQFSGRTTPLTVAGPPGTEYRIREAMEILFPGSSTIEREFDVDVVDIPAGVATTFDSITVTPSEVPHASGAPAFALRVEFEDRVIAYSGDCEWNDALVDVSRDADLFVCEGYFFDKQVAWHLDYATVQEHLDELHCKRLVLTHMSADMLARPRELEIECAEDGLEISL